jgi:hypothetical protein
MDISQAKCLDCGRPLKISRLSCSTCKVALEGDFDLSPLVRLPLEDQVFVMAFVRHHGSIKKMETLFGISYPTVKNRLNGIAARLDKSFEVSTPNSLVLKQLRRGDITVDEALEKLV